MDIITGAGQLATFLPVLDSMTTPLDMLGARLAVLDLVSGYLGGGPGGPWRWSGRGFTGSAATAALALLPVLVAELLVLAGCAAVSARRRQRQLQPSRNQRAIRRAAVPQCHHGIC